MSIVELMRRASQGAYEQGRIYGVVVGIVRDVKDPDNLGRVKVDFPWLASESESVSITGDDTRAHSFWARVATLMAGGKRGSFFIPEVDDEVLVAFEHGDPNRPFVLGSLWNSDDLPPEAMDSDGKNHIRAVHSRSGHKIVLDDSDDKPSILIVDQTGENSIFIDSANNAMEIKVAKNLSIDVGGDISIAVKGKVDMDVTKDMTVQTQSNLEFTATGNGTLESTGPMDIKSNAKATFEGAASAEVKAPTVTINGSGMAEVKGGLVKIN